MEGSECTHQFASIKVRLGNKNPSNMPKSSRQTASPAKFCTKPFAKQTIPQHRAAVGITTLKPRRFTMSAAGSSMRMYKG